MLTVSAETISQLKILSGNNFNNALVAKSKMGAGAFSYKAKLIIISLSQKQEIQRKLESSDKNDFSFLAVGCKMLGTAGACCDIHFLSFGLSNDVLKEGPLRGDNGNDKNHVIISLLLFPLI